ERIANAARLREAGVLFAFTTYGERSPGAFWTDLRRAVEAGLPKEAALRALTIDAARIMGVERQMGTVEAGKIANLVVMTGDFADARTKARYLFIDRSKFEIEPERERTPTRTTASPAPAAVPSTPGAAP